MNKKEIESGKSFHEAARDYSEDPSAKMNGGNLGYFSAFQMVTPFEDAVYNATPGKVTGPVRTNFGWHLILVQDIRQNRGELKVAHIMKMFPRDGRGYDKGIYKSQIDSIYKLIQNGADFAKLARDLSDDKQSAVEGGEMPWFSAGRMIPEFAEPAFRLQNNGDFSEPVESPYGYHIIKRIDHRPVKSFEELKPEIEEMIKRDPTRSVSSKKSFIEKLKKEYKFICNTENINALAKDSVNGKFLNSASTLFSMDGKNFTRAQLNDFLATKGIISGKYPLGIDDWIEHEITNHEDSKLESKYPEFGFTVREYHDGILLFNISQEKIWDFAVKDSAGLEKYYTKNKGKYMWGERFKGMVVNCRDSAVYQQACGYFDSGMSVSEVKLLLNKENDEKVNIIEGAWEKGANQAVDYFIWNMPKTDAFDERTTFVRGDLVKPARKNLEEARGYYISDYQNYLEKQWIKELRKKYKIKVNKVLLDEVKSVE
jgi:peptidyl-prolyl cis-trans isomerase SurA